jgi:hypothetical protein
MQRRDRRTGGPVKRGTAIDAAENQWAASPLWRNRINSGQPTSVGCAVFGLAAQFSGLLRIALPVSDTRSRQLRSFHDNPFRQSVQRVGGWPPDAQ